jgi:hypothetical protein
LSVDVVNPVSCRVFKLASEPLTISFFQFGISMFLLWLDTQNEPTSVMAYNTVINIKLLFIIERFCIKFLEF